MREHDTDSDYSHRLKGVKTMKVEPLLNNIILRGCPTIMDLYGCRSMAENDWELRHLDIFMIFRRYLRPLVPTKLLLIIGLYLRSNGQEYLQLTVNKDHAMHHVLILPQTKTRAQRKHILRNISRVPASTFKIKRPHGEDLYCYIKNGRALRKTHWSF